MRNKIDALLHGAIRKYCNNDSRVITVPVQETTGEIDFSQCQMVWQAQKVFAAVYGNTIDAYPQPVSLFFVNFNHKIFF